MKLALKYALMLAFVGNVIPAWAQIKNGSFEQCTAYPSQPGQIDLVAGWSNAGSATASPDFFHYAGNMAGDIPVTPVGVVDAFQGSAIAGFAAAGIPGSNFREYLCNHLTDPAVVGDDYRLSLQVSNGTWTQGSLSGLKTSHLGLYLSVGAPTQVDNQPLNVTPNAVLDTVVFSRDWVKLTYHFTATQPYRYMTFGVFGDDTDKTIDIEDGTAPQVAYYFVDDVHLVSLSVPEQNVEYTDNDRGQESEDPITESDAAELTFYIPNAFTPNQDGDNDVFAPVLPEVRDYHLQIFSRWGDVVYDSDNPASGWDGRTPKGESAQPGMYIWQIAYLKKTGDDWTPAERQGTVYLMH